MFGVYMENIRYMQYISAFAGTLAVACCSMYVSWPSPVLPQLTSSNSPIGTTVTNEEGSWIASSFLLGSIPASLVLPYFIENFGRKRTLLMSGLLSFTPWMIILFTKSVLLICIARSIGGAANIFATVGCVIYIGEITEKDIRGKASLIIHIIALCSIFFVLAIGPFVSYTALNISCCIWPVVFVTLISFVPESPYFLVKVGKIDEARTSLVRLSTNITNTTCIEKRLRDIRNTVEYETINKGTLWELLTRADHRKALILITGVKTLQQLSGNLAIQGYMQPIIEASNSNISPKISSIIFGAIQLPSAVVAAILVDKLGRKTLLIISALGCALALIAEGIYFYLQDFVKADTSTISWMPTSGLVIFLIMNSLGVYNLPFVLLGEIFQTNVKGIAVSLMTCYGAVLGFMAIRIFEPISAAWGIYTIFWAFAGVSISGAAFVLFLLPETKGKSFDDIQKKLNNNVR